MIAKEMQRLPKEAAVTLKGTLLAKKAQKCTKNERATLPTALLACTFGAGEP